MSDDDVRDAEVAVLGEKVVADTARIEELEVERDKLQFDLQACREELARANRHAGELQAKLFAIGLLLRP